jgi:hypothetical protein
MLAYWNKEAAWLVEYSFNDMLIWRRVPSCVNEQVHFTLFYN